MKKQTPTGVPVMREAQQQSLRPDLREIVENRKSGLSLNWIVGCPLECSYCVRHLFANFDMKIPRALVSDERAFETLISHPYFRAHLTPIQLLNRATDPFLPRVKQHAFNMLEMLDEAGLTNHVLIISRWRITAEDCQRLNNLANLRVSLLITYSGIDDEQIEPVDSEIAVTSLMTAYTQAQRFRVIFYWRPIVPGINDSADHIARAMELTTCAHAVVFTGIFYRDEIRDYYVAQGLPEPYETTARRKILPESLESRILAAAGARRYGAPLFRKTSCAVSYAHGRPDYNGHVGIEELCDICPESQRSRCQEHHHVPGDSEIRTMVEALGGRVLSISARSVVVGGLGEQDRYLVQHRFAYQVHDIDKPHRSRRHGRADLGWPAMSAQGAGGT